MEQGENLKRYNRPTRLQLRYLTELDQIGGKRGCVGVIAEICGVNHGSVSRFFKTCCANGLLTPDFHFTEAGRLWLQSYQKLVRRLESHLRRIGIAEKDLPDHVQNLIENVDYSILAAMLRGSSLGQREKTAARKPETAQNVAKEVISYGTYPVDFILFKLDRQAGYERSMADRGFEKPGLLRHSRRGSYLELSICEMNAHSRIDGAWMTGHLEALKYERDGVLQEAMIRQGKIKIPLDACVFQKRQGGELRGEVLVTATCNVGRVHMPESTAILIFWL